MRAMRWAFVAFLLTVGVAVICVWQAYLYTLAYPTRALGSGGRKISVKVPRGVNFNKVVEILASRDVLDNKVAFRIYANYKGVATKVRAGAYKLDSDVTPKKLLDILVHGVPAPTISVLIPEGKNMLEVAQILHDAGIARRSALLEYMRNPRFLRRIGVPAASMEGYLFPDTYRLRRPTPVQEVLAKLARRHKGVYYGLRRKHKGQLAWLRKKLRWGHHEIVTMASIVEKETGKAHERPLIAGVFLNRLTFRSFQPKFLQTDPTIIYGCVVPERKSSACRTFKGRIRRRHLIDMENPYNTYTHVKLPPGPIANPGRAALRAVLAPTKSRFLYFVSKNDGTHKFSATRAEHERAVDKYQRGK